VLAIVTESLDVTDVVFVDDESLVVDPPTPGPGPDDELDPPTPGPGPDDDDPGPGPWALLTLLVPVPLVVVVVAPDGPFAPPTPLLPSVTEPPESHAANAIAMSNVATEILPIIVFSLPIGCSPPGSPLALALVVVALLASLPWVEPMLLVPPFEGLVVAPSRSAVCGHHSVN
jgi:hypothetical protein